MEAAGRDSFNSRVSRLNRCGQIALKRPRVGCKDGRGSGDPPSRSDQDARLAAVRVNEVDVLRVPPKTGMHDDRSLVASLALLPLVPEPH